MIEMQNICNIYDPVFFLLSILVTKHVKKTNTTYEIEVLWLSWSQDTFLLDSIDNEEIPVIMTDLLQGTFIPL